MSRDIELVTQIAVSPDLWTSAIMPEGILERWMYDDGSEVKAGDAIAAVRIESALHDLMAPCRGRLKIDCRNNSVIEPGAVIGRITRTIAM
ncbi:MAG TPA: biotin/lipoyl-containing protein [Rhizomicrobium sp.]|nr:biotin/lipoyl-containing protein [Rhizomicrobium sp.]